MRQSAVVVGEALVDVLIDDGVERRAPGGSPLNVAIGLSRLGVPARLVTQLGDDPDGDLVRAHLAASDVTVEAAPQPTTSVAEARIGADGAATYDFAVAWELPSTSLGPCTLFHCGSIAAYLPPGAGSVDDLLDQAVAAGAFTSFDPNIRPAFLADPEAAWARTRELAARCDLVKLSDEDAAYLAPALGADPTDVDGVADALLAGARTRAVVVTEGGRGPFARSRSRPDLVVRVADGGPVRVADTVGAGDSFMAALLAVVALRLERRLPPLDDDALGAHLSAADAAARVTVGRPGADPPWRRELDPAWAQPACADR